MIVLWYCLEASPRCQNGARQCVHTSKEANPALRNTHQGLKNCLGKKKTLGKEETLVEREQNFPHVQRV